MRWIGAIFGARLRTMLMGLVSLVLIGLVFYLGARSERSGFIRDVVDPGWRSLSNPVLNAFRGRPPAVARIDLHLAPAAWDSIEARSQRAQRDRYMEPEWNNALAARLTTSDRDMAVQVRLRDGAMIAARSSSWPLQVRMAIGDTVQALRVFDMVPVNGPGVLWSMVYQAILADQGHAALGWGLAEVTVNERDLGLCALLGRTDTGLPPDQGNGKGPVLLFDDRLYWHASMAMAGRTFTSSPPPQGDWLVAPLLVQQADGDHRTGRARKAIQRMEAFRRGTLQASEVFATHDLARTLALSDLLGMTAAMDWWNLRFLVDSVGEKLLVLPQHTTVHSPIGALQAEEVNAEHSNDFGREWVNAALRDPVVRELYLAYLDSFAVNNWWDVVRERTRPQWEHARKVIHAEDPRSDLDLGIVAHDLRVIRQALNPKDIALAYVSDTLAATDGVVIANVHSLPICVVGVVLSTGDTSLLNTIVELPPRSHNRPLRYTYLPLSVPGSPREIIVRLGAALPPRTIRIRTWTTFGAN